MQHFQNVQCSVPDTLHVFLITYDNYQYNIAYLVLWNSFILSQNCISPQYLSYYWCLSLVLCTRVHTLDSINAWRIHTYEHNHHVYFFILRRVQSIFLTFIIIHTWSFFMFIRFRLTRNCCIDAFWIFSITWRNYRLNLFVDMSNCFVDAFFDGSQFNFFCTYPNVILDFNYISNMFD